MVRILRKNGLYWGKKGFTLVELFIVAALIALLSGIAVFNIQREYKTSQMRITVGETNQIATSLAFAYQDTDIFPKLCFLNQSYTMLMKLWDGDNLDIFADFDTMGYGVPETKISAGWEGAYFSMSQGRGRNPGGGFVNMLLPNSGAIMAWPADLYGQPYVVYQIVLDPTNYQPRFINNWSESPDQFNAVVSYGQNKMVGGPDVNEAVVADPTDLLNKRLFEVSTTAGANFDALRPDEYNALRLAGYQDVIGNNGPSDDIVREF